MPPVVASQGQIYTERMTIAVLAASGRSGRAFVSAALDAGHVVRAGSRSGQLNFTRENLTVVGCDATNPQQVAALIRGADAVVSLIGHDRRSPAFVQSDAMRVLIAAMGEAGIKRLISLTGTGVRLPGDKIDLVDRFLNFAIAKIDPKRIKDGLEHAVILQDCPLDWTIVRVLKLSPGPSRRFVLAEHGPSQWLTPRAEVAQAILQVLADGSFIRQMPILTNGRSRQKITE